MPGAIYKVELDNSHPLAFGYGKNYFSLKLSGDIYEFMKSGWNVGIIKKESQAAGFVGSRTKERIKDGTVLGVQSLGGGSIVFFADDIPHIPEFLGKRENAFVQCGIFSRAVEVKS